MSEDLLSKEHVDNVLLTAGNVLRGDDAVGPLMAKDFADAPLDGWTVIDGGQTPEDDLATIRRIAPAHIVLVDGAAMGLPPGSIRRLTADLVKTDYMVTTHSLPMTFLLAQLHEIADDVVFLGVQIAKKDFYDPMTPAVQDAVTDIERHLREGADLNDYPLLTDEA